MEGTELAQAVAEYPSVRAAARGLGIPEGTIRRRLKKVDPAEQVPAHGFVPSDEHLPDTHVGPDGVKTHDLWAQHEGVQRYILTSAQNNTRVHQGFLKNLEAFAKWLDAKMLVSFSVYDKAGYRGPVPKGETTQKKREVWWDKAIMPYVVNERVKLAKRLAFCAELDVLATTRNPLSGLDSYCGRSSFIAPHNKFEFRCVEARKGHLPKEMYTTGSVTDRNFIQRKTGQLASFHHVLGAVMVEVQPDGFWHVHHLNADDDDSFYWLDRYVSNGKVRKNPHGIPALILGDIHYEKIDPTALSRILLDQDSVIKTLKPDRVFVHDLIDFSSRNYYNRRDPEFAAYYAKRQQTVAEEVRESGQFLSEVANHTGEVIVVPSNHHEAFRKWIHETDWRDDIVNADIYLATAQAMLQQVEHRGLAERLDPLKWAIEDYCDIRLPDRVKFLGEDERYEINGVECGMHGHIGPSGARGTPANLAKLPFKTFTAHTHTPSIKNGCYTVGLTGKLDLDYNRGPSKWLHAHGIVYPNGKRAFLFVKNNRWKGE
jgi:hypothetical protein